MTKSFRLIVAVLFLLLLSGCEQAVVNDGPTPGASTAAPTGKASALSASKTGASATTPAATSDGTGLPYQKAGSIDIHAAGGVSWQEGLSDYQPISQDLPSSKKTNTFHLREYDADFLYRTSETGAGTLVVEKTMAVSWTLPDTIHPGDKLRIPLNITGKYVETYLDTDGIVVSTEEKPYDPAQNFVGNVYVDYYYGANRTTGYSSGGYDTSSLQDFDNRGYVEIEVSATKPYQISRAIQIRITFSVGDMQVGKIYYYER
jgi:uncharacterized protein YceK